MKNENLTLEEYIFFTTKQDKFKGNAFLYTDKQGQENYIIENMGKDTYKSVSLYSEPTVRRAYNIGSLIALVLDVEAMGHAFDITLSDAKKLVEQLKNEFDVNMPKPSKIIHSGRGLHFWYEIEPSTDLQKYQLVLKRLQDATDELIGRYDALTQVKADRKVNYASLIRVEGTYNTEAKAFAHKIYTSNATYTLDGLIERYIGDLRGIIGTGELQRSQTAKKHRKEFKTFKKEFKGYRKDYTKQSLQKKVLEDLHKLQEIRATNIMRVGSTYINIGIEGFRNKMLFIYAVYAKYYYQDTKEAYKALQAFNEGFKPSPLEERELNEVFASSVNNNYITMKLANIAAQLEMDREEMRDMQVIFCNEERKARRYLSKCKSRGKRTQANQEAKQKLIQECKDLKEQGFTYRQISENLGIGLATINRYLSVK